MWKVIYIAHGAGAAQNLETLLRKSGFMCRVHVVGSRRSGVAGAYEIEVPESEADDAYEVLCENGFKG